MDILENYTNYNRFMLQEGLSVDSNSCTEYTLSRRLIRKLELEEINNTCNNKRLYLLQKRIENGSMNFLLKVQGYVERGCNAFDICDDISLKKYEC